MILPINTRLKSTSIPSSVKIKIRFELIFYPLEVRSVIKRGGE